jgi:hypothetical protein
MQRIARRRLLISVVILVVLALVASRYVWRKRDQDKRAAGYQSTLRSYSKDLKPGMTRKEVENYLQAKGVPVLCRSGDRGACDDLTRIGEEDAPFYCSHQNIYIAFKFTAVEQHRPLENAYPSDVLDSVTIMPWLEYCL